MGTISTIANQQPYDFSGINVGIPANTGVQAPIHVRSIRYGIASGTKWIPGKPWEWFEFYELNNPVPRSGEPAVWSQYAQGSAPGLTGSGASGSFYISPIPDDIYVLNCDCVCYPQFLNNNGDVEAIPYLFTDAVPYFAAYYALMSAQTNARLNDALQYYKIYQEFLGRARRAANPSPNRWQYEQAGDPAQGPKMGIKGAA